MEFDNWWISYFQGHFSEQNFHKRLSISFFSLQENPEKEKCIYLFIQIIFLNTFDFSYVPIVDKIAAKGDTNVEGPFNAGEDKKKEEPQQKR